MKRLVCLIALLSILIPTTSAYAQSHDEAAALFYEANEQYKQEHYDDAVQSYEEILKKGFASWTVYYNLGNSYFKKDQSGRALLNYIRAKELEPRDADLNSNYRYALSQVNNDLVLSKSFGDILWEKHCDFYTADEMLIVIFTLLFALVLVHLGSLYMQWPSLRRNAVIALLVLGIVVFVYGFKLKLDSMSNAAVAVAAADAKYEPLDNATAYFQLPEGARVKVLKEEGGWAKVEREDGKLGWVKFATIEKL